MAVDDQGKSFAWAIFAIALIAAAAVSFNLLTLSGSARYFSDHRGAIFLHNGMYTLVDNGNRPTDPSYDEVGSIEIGHMRRRANFLIVYDILIWVRINNSAVSRAEIDSWIGQIESLWHVRVGSPLEPATQVREFARYENPSVPVQVDWRLTSLSLVLLSSLIMFPIASVRWFILRKRERQRLRRRRAVAGGLCPGCG